MGGEIDTKTVLYTLDRYRPTFKGRSSYHLRQFGWACRILHEVECVRPRKTEHMISLLCGFSIRKEEVGDTTRSIWSFSYERLDQGKYFTEQAIVNDNILYFENHLTINFESACHKKWYVKWCICLIISQYATHTLKYVVYHKYIQFYVK